MMIAIQDYPTMATTIEYRDPRSLIPAPQNEKIYRKITRKSVAELAADIRERGVVEPLLITPSGVIISGHRRHKAAIEAGLDEVPVRVLPIREDDPGFVKLLVACNSQRVKGVEELLKEQLVKVDPAEVSKYARRVQQERLDHGGGDLGQEVMKVTGSIHRRPISPKKRPFADAIIQAIKAQRKFWPLSVRTVHYMLLNSRPLKNANKSASRYENNRTSYQELSRVLTDLRMADEVPWSAISDDTRPTVIWHCWSGPQPFIQKSTKDLLEGYNRDLLQSQPCHIEVAGEKLTIGPIIKPVCSEFTMTYQLGRGFTSSDAKRKLAERFWLSGKDRMVLLMLSDFDPSGNEISESFVRSMRSDFGIHNITAIRVALTPEQVELYNLPPLMTAKEDDSRTAKFIEQHGAAVFELEALEPEDLQGVLRDSIRSVLNIDLYNAELEAEQEDIKRILEVKTKLSLLIGNLADAGDEEQ